MKFTLIYFSQRPEWITLALKAGLKYFPNELGLLLFTIEGNSPYALLMDKNGTTKRREEGWSIIEECFEEVQKFRLPEPDPTTNLYEYPFLFAARDQSCPCVDLVYYLLRKEPSVLLQFDNGEKRHEGSSTKRKRKNI